MVSSIFFSSIGEVTLNDLAEIGQAKLSDDKYGDVKISGVATIDTAKSDEITFLTNIKYADNLKNSNALACITSANLLDKAPDGMPVIISDNPHYSYALIARYMYKDESSYSICVGQELVSPTAKIGKNSRIETGAVLGDNVTVGDNCFIGTGAVVCRGVHIGDNCNIYSNVTISHAIIGNNVTIYSGAVIGKEGFGFATHHGQHIRVPQLGSVVIGDNVSIGGNSTVDRGSCCDTLIGDYCQIDNLVQIAHNVKMGRGCVIAAQAGVAGSTKLGDYVVLGGQVGVAGHLNIGTGVQIAAQSGLTKDASSGKKLGGTPAVSLAQYHRQAITLRKITNKKTG
jgi:UDP-3-O-[3-hydroxymyristoyl] glucosamine N-acyltransferase